MHERCTLPVRAFPVGHRVNEGAVLVKNVRDEGNEPVHLAPPVLKILEANRDVIIGARPVLPVRPRPSLAVPGPGALHAQAGVR